MSLFAVLVDTDMRRVPGVQPALPKVVAHNLTRAAADELTSELSGKVIEGEPSGWTPYLWSYAECHAETDPSNCLECEEIVLNHCKHALRLLEQEKAKRSPK